MCIFVLISEDVLYSFYFKSYLVGSCITILVMGLENQHLHGIPVIHFASVNSLTAPSPTYLYLLSASTLSFSLRLSWSDFVCLCLFNLSHTTAHLTKKIEKNPTLSYSLNHLSLTFSYYHSLLSTFQYCSHEIASQEEFKKSLTYLFVKFVCNLRNLIK